MNVASTMEELARVRDAGKASETEQSAQVRTYGRKLAATRPISLVLGHAHHKFLVLAT